MHGGHPTDSESPLLNVEKIKKLKKIDSAHQTPVPAIDAASVRIHQPQRIEPLI
jgi:hypothetical protein